MFEATTILGYRGELNHKKFALIGGDGQVTLGNCVVKANATKIRSLYHNQVLSGLPEAPRTLLVCLICLNAF